MTIGTTRGAAKRSPAAPARPTMSAVPGQAELVGKPARRLQVTAFRCEPLADVEPQALGFTYFFDAAPGGQPYPVSIRFTGRRAGVRGRPRPNDVFDVTETIEGVVPGSGRLAITLRVTDVAPGEWQVTATPLDAPLRRTRAPRSATPRQRRLAAASAAGRSGYGPIIQVLAPGAHLGAWPALVSLGVVAGLAAQGLLAAHDHLHAATVLGLTLAASLVGLLGAKLYYVAGHYLLRHFMPGHSNDERPPVITAGMCIQGFVAGLVVALLLGALATGLPSGALLDASTPGLFIGMTIGRFGCFFGGCCTGRPTASRWGLWSCDRRLAVRRIPVQLLESALALLIATSTFVAMWATTPRPLGMVFIGAIAAYTLGRQLLFPLRDNPRKTAHGRQATIALTGAAALFTIAVGVLR
ncbi:MAG: prolipoprotein diacylglyceryl transferase family protein [Acidimicrobiales bacterium]